MRCVSRLKVACKWCVLASCPLSMVEKMKHDTRNHTPRLEIKLQWHRRCGNFSRLDSPYALPLKFTRAGLKIRRAKHGDNRAPSGLRSRGRIP